MTKPTYEGLAETESDKYVRSMVAVLGDEISNYQVTLAHGGYSILHKAHGILVFNPTARGFVGQIATINNTLDIIRRTRSHG